MPDRDRNLPHFYWSKEVKPEKYTSLGTPVNTPPNPERDRAKHAQILEQAIGSALQKAREQLDRRDPNLAKGEPGFLLEFKVKADSTRAFENLQNAQKKIELLAVTKSPGQDDFVNATVFVPESASEFYLKKIRKYRDKDTDDTNGRPKNAPLVTRLETIQIGKVKSLFTDRSASFPEERQEVWWEVWLLKERRKNFDFIAKKLNIPTKSTNTLSFPEREIVLAMTTVETLAIIIRNTNAIAELRIAKDNPSVFLNDMGSIEQEKWCQDLIS